MNSPYYTLKEIITNITFDAIKKLNYNIAYSEILKTIEFSKGYGDFSCSIAFKISKEANTDPSSIAKKILENIKKDNIIEDVKVEKGFVNFYIDKKWYIKETLKYIFDIENKIISNIGNNEKIIIEYPSANPVHPIHIGQLRNALLGDTLSNIYDNCNYQVERQDYIDDLGLQMVEALWGYINLDVKKDSNIKFDHFLGKLYVDVNEYMKSHDIKNELDVLSKEVEKNDTPEAKLRREVAERCVLAQYQTLFDYNIYHDLMIWESDILATKMLDDALKILDENKITEYIEDGEYKGCLVINLNKFTGLPKELYDLKNNTKVLVRSNGTPTYLAKDIAFHMYKLGIIKKEFKYKKWMQQDNNKPLYTTYFEGASLNFGHAKKAINIIDYRQNYPQLLLKEVIKKINKESTDSIIHLSYGTVGFEGIKLAGRKGTWIGNTADDLLNEAKSKALLLIKDKFKLSDDEKQYIAKKVALSAIKFEFLKISPEKNITFSWSRALNFEGDSGPYCQYMYARANRLLEDSNLKIEPKIIDKIDTKFLEEELEFELIKELSRITEIVEKSAVELRPNIITDYTIKLASLFSRFYGSSLILKAKNEDERLTKLVLTKSFSIVIKRMLAILGIETVEKM
ncbi:MAG: arginine--tRNA ligase [Candidatus Micrarchaeia archaeon]